MAWLGPKNLHLPPPQVSLTESMSPLPAAGMTRGHWAQAATQFPRHWRGHCGAGSCCVDLRRSPRPSPGARRASRRRSSSASCPTSGTSSSASRSWSPPTRRSAHPMSAPIRRLCHVQHNTIAICLFFCVCVNYQGFCDPLSKNNTSEKDPEKRSHPSHGVKRKGQ